MGEVRAFAFVRFKQAKDEEFLLGRKPEIMLGGRKVILAWGRSLGSGVASSSKVPSSYSSEDDNRGARVLIRDLEKGKQVVKSLGASNLIFRAPRPNITDSKGRPSSREVLVGKSNSAY